MATFLDVAGLQMFSDFFVFILVWLAIVAILTATKALGDNKAVHWIIGLIIGLLVWLSPIAIGSIKFIIPWFGVIFIFVLFFIMALRLFGVSSGYFENLKWILDNKTELNGVLEEAQAIRKHYDNVIFCGMGGSGLSVEVVKDMFGSRSKEGTSEYSV